MGCDIHSFAEKKTDSGYEPVDQHPFSKRNHEVFGFLADVRNYSAVTPISTPRGLPGDVSAYVRDKYRSFGMDAHTPSWLSVAELAAFNYDAETDEGVRMTWREFLGDGFFEDLAKLKESGADRVVFWFDN